MRDELVTSAHEEDVIEFLGELLPPERDEMMAGAFATLIDPPRGDGPAPIRAARRHVRRTARVQPEL